MGLGVDWGETLGDPGEHSYVDVWVSVPDSVAVEFFDRVGSVPEVGVSVNCENELQKKALYWFINDSHYKAAKRLVDAGVRMNKSDLKNCGEYGRERYDEMVAKADKKTQAA